MCGYSAETGRRKQYAFSDDSFQKFESRTLPKTTSLQKWLLSESFTHLMLHVREVYCPYQCDNIDIRDSEAWRDEVEINNLQRRGSILLY